jgi:hypothetical protein
MKRRLFYGVAAAILALAASPAGAADINFKFPISQSGFESLTKEAGAALGYRNLTSAEPLGITGFDVGFEVSAMSIDKNSAYWSSAFGSDAPAYLVVPKLRARKGLPFGIDVGAMYSSVPDSNVKLFGFELSKAILEGGIATPAVGVRATYTKMTGVDDLGLQTYGVDASVSKGFLFITPYAGAGLLRINSEAKGHLQAISTNLSDVSTTVLRYFGGVKITPLPLFSVTAEAEYAEQPVYSLKVAFTF